MPLPLSFLDRHPNCIHGKHPIMKRRLILYFSLVFFLYSFTAHGQQYIWSPDSISRAEPNYAMDRYHDILRYHDPFMYLAFPLVKPIVHRKIALEDGEGKNGYILEGNFAYRFTAYQGKYYSYPFLQHLRFTLDVDLTTRLTRDRSNPLLPANNKFGLGLDYLLSPLRELKKEKATLVWTTLQLHHYSNGQADSFFLDKPVQRNNYASGDFSTNYYRFLLNLSHSAYQKSIVTAAIGYQRDIDLGGPLGRNRQLLQYYGNNRLLFNFQLTKKPRLVTSNYQNRSTAEQDVVKVEVKRQLTYRTELEYITGDLSRFSGDNKRRLGWHNYLTYMPSVTNEVGFILHTYLGRDYLNIRFDDVVFIGEAGLYIKFQGK